MTKEPTFWLADRVQCSICLDWFFIADCKKVKSRLKGKDRVYKCKNSTCPGTEKDFSKEGWE